jgi:hypothetical protein
MTTFYCLTFESPPTWGARSPYLYPPEQGSPFIPPGTGFPFRRLLLLAGLRWRYSTPPQHGSIISSGLGSLLYSLGRIQQETPFPNNPFIVACVFAAAGTCLQSRCLVINVYSGFALPAFRLFVTIYCLFNYSIYVVYLTALSVAQAIASNGKMIRE